MSLGQSYYIIVFDEQYWEAEPYLVGPFERKIEAQRFAKRVYRDLTETQAIVTKPIPSHDEFNKEQENQLAVGLPPL